MKRIITLCCVCCGLAGSLVGVEETGFTARLGEADYKAAGLDKLTPAERARLDELVAEERRQEASVAVKKTSPGGVLPGPKPPVTRGKIAGVLTGWREGTVLTFEDGSRWKVVSKGSYRAAPVRNGPKVELVPMANGDFVMTVETVPRRAEVRRVTE